MHAQLASIRRELDVASDRVSRLAEWAGDEHWGVRPSAESWSASECVQHLNATTRAMVPLIREQLDASEPLPKVPGYRLSVFGWLILRSVSPSGKMKVTTTELFVPPQARPVKVDLVAWAVCQADLTEQLERADGHPLNRLKIASPFNRRIRYNLYSAFRILVAHQMRHLDQAEKAIEAVRLG